MLHRLTLRVLPRLTLAVTEEQVRKRKRLVMLACGAVAFVLYRGVRHFALLSDPLMLLELSGLISAAAAAWGYRIGRRAPWSTIWREDEGRRVSWLIGWVGVVYGVQLTLLVLALLKVILRYDFLRHPEGPAMMAVIIACTSVARDAFEIGHIRQLQQRGEPVLTFPDGAALRALLREQPWKIGESVLLAAAGSALVALAVSGLGEPGASDLGQLLAVSLFAGSVAVWAYLAGEQRSGGWPRIFGSGSWLEVCRFWWWPGVAFAATYYLVQVAIVIYALRWESTGIMVRGLLAGTTAGLLALYCYYLGYRRHLEDQVQELVPKGLLRCPFVVGLLSKTGVQVGERAVSPPEVVMGGPARRV